MKSKAPAPAEQGQPYQTARSASGPTAQRGWPEATGKRPPGVQLRARSDTADTTPSVLPQGSIAEPPQISPFGSIDNKPRLVAQRQPMVSFLGSASVQRKIKIGEEITPSGGMPRKATVKEFLEKYGLHYYYSYSKIEDEVQSSKEFRGADGALELAQLLGARMDVMDADADEVQKNIQRKMIEIAELFRVSMTSGIEDAQQKGEREKWYDDFIFNGLCLGFVKIFEAHPDWMMGMWETLRTWRPPHGAAVAAIVADLNRHIETYMRFGDGMERYNILEPVLLAQEAWNNMKEQEEEEEEDGGDERDNDNKEDGNDDEEEDSGYQDPPDWVGDIRGSASSLRSESVEDDRTWNVADVAAGARWDRVRDYIIEKTAGSFGWFHVIVYHSGHEMAVRYYHSDGGQDRWYAVETVGTGMVRRNSWAEVGEIIAPRLAEAADEFGAEIKRQTPI